MKSKVLKTMTVVLALSVCVGLSACGKAEGGKADSGKMSSGSMTSKTSTASTAQGTQAVEMDKDMMSGTFVASMVNWPNQDVYEYKYMGLKFTLPESLLKKMENKEIAMLPNEEVFDDYSTKHAFFSWRKMTEEQSKAEVDKMGDAYLKWVDSLEMEGALGMFNSDMSEDDVKKITGCDNVKLLGETKDGKYKYYIGTSSSGDKEVLDEVNQIKTEIIEKEQMTSNGSVFTDPAMMAGARDAKTIAPLSTTTVNGEAFTEKDFSKYELTMVNVFATWCTACVKEIPDVEKLYQEMKDKGVNIVGVVTDTVDDTGENAEAIELAKKIAEKTGATYPFLKPDSTQFNGRLIGIEALPETFFVDKDGNIVGDVYSGSHSYEDWKKIVEEVLSKVKK